MHILRDNVTECEYIFCTLCILLHIFICILLLQLNSSFTHQRLITVICQFATFICPVD